MSAAWPSSGPPHARTSTPTGATSTCWWSSSPCAGDGYADAYFGLREALEALFGRDVDLVAPSAIRNPYIRADVERTRTLVYAA